jgi:hypothetical protein
MAEETQGSSGWESTLTLVGSSVTVVASVLGTVGITVGVITALLRNNPGWTLTAMALVGLGVLLGVAGAVLRRAAPEALHEPATDAQRTQYERDKQSAKRFAVLRRVAALLSLLLVGFGIGWFVKLAADSLRTTDRPTIAATFTAGSDTATATLEITVTASGMTTGERYYIRVELFNDERQDVPPRELFYTFAGPGADGKLEYKLKIAVPYDPVYPLVGITAQRQREGEVPGHVQNCGLPVEPPTSPTPSAASPSPSPTASVAASASASVRAMPLPSSQPSNGTTCAVVRIVKVPASASASSGH